MSLVLNSEVGVEAPDQNQTRPFRHSPLLHQNQFTCWLLERQDAVGRSEVLLEDFLDFLSGPSVTENSGSVGHRSVALGIL